ncbi:MAG TPA: 3'-5' exoribonuclease [Solirubrobacterales bacterium]|nr:3'-5' exoribonuclease [Solirubrobacterales bacterium]
MSERADVYFSADIEADGPIPGPYSMLSFGLVVAARFDGHDFEARDPEAETFYRELQPISGRFDPEALRVGGLDRDLLIREGRTPTDAMSEAAIWVDRIAAKDRAILVAFPASFDWLYLYWYFVRFSRHGSPFDFSSCLDMKTIFQQRAMVVMDRAGIGDLSPELKSEHPHTHNALDDALRQAEIFQRLWYWRLGESK